jgi:hypothetical protein
MCNEQFGVSREQQCSREQGAQSREQRANSS